MAAPLVFSGSLEEIPLPDIARLFQATRKTGKLALSSGYSSGAIYFFLGDIVDCDSTNMSGLDAIKHVALFNRGNFEFNDGATSGSQTLDAYSTAEIIGFLETRMLESRQLQELVPSSGDIPRYLGGAIPSGFEVTAADLSVALKASAGTLSVRTLALDLNLDETMISYVIARYRAAGLMEIVGRDETVADRPEPSSAPPLGNASVPGARTTGALPPGATQTTQIRYWRGRKIEG